MVDEYRNVSRGSRLGLAGDDYVGQTLMDTLVLSGAVEEGVVELGDDRPLPRGRPPPA